MVQCGVIHVHCNAVRWKQIKWTRNIMFCVGAENGIKYNLILYNY